MKRLIGDFGDKNSDTLVLFIGGLHGNETSGVVALERVFEELKERNPKFKGRFVGLRGNKKALKKGKRFLKIDLNRLWSDEMIAYAIAHPKENPEYKEMAGLSKAFKKIGFENYKRKIFIDLHTTSAEDGVFVIVKDYEKSSFIVKHLHTPLLLGLENELKNTTVPYFYDKGFTAFGFEAGQIGSEEAVHNQLSTVWHSLERCGCISEDDLPIYIKNYDALFKFTDRLPSMLKMQYSHKLKGDEGFKMLPGFRNYSKVLKNDLLAHDKNGEIRAKRDGYLLMPLYQKAGNDGFFLIDQDGVEEYLK